MNGKTPSNKGHFIFKVSSLCLLLSCIFCGVASSEASAVEEASASAMDSRVIQRSTFEIDSGIDVMPELFVVLSEEVEVTDLYIGNFCSGLSPYFISSYIIVRPIRGPPLA